MTYEKLKEMTEGKHLPLIGKNEDGEVVIIEAGESNGEKFFKATTVQHNDWCRLNIYWENGTTGELYRK